MPMPSTTMSSTASQMISSAAAAPTAAAKMGHMSMGEGRNCKISMLWNWYTIDACFLSRSWYITSKSMFAGSCIGVIILVMILEFLRRLAKEYDRRLVRQHQQRFGSQSSSPSSTPHINDSANKDIMSSMTKKLLGVPNPTVFRPHLGQQMLRALLHMLQFAVAYFIMLLAMYYNGYILICIFIGAYLGFFVFEWESADMDGPKEEATLCCG